MDDLDSCRPPSLPALLAGFATLYLVWGSTFLGIKLAVESLPPLLMASGRFLLAGAVLYAALRISGVARPASGEWRAALITGGLLLLGGNGLMTWGQQTIPSGTAALIIATTPLWMVLLGYFFYQGERPGLLTCLGLACGFAGAMLLIHLHAGKSGVGSLPGALAVAASPLVWSVGSLESRRRPVPHALLHTSMQMLAGGALLLLAGSLWGEWPVLLVRPISTRSVLAFFYLTTLGALVGFTTYAWLLRVASPTAVSTYAYVNPLVAVLLGWLLGGEDLDSTVLLPAGLIVGAVILISRPKTPAVVTPPHRAPPARSADGRWGPGRRALDTTAD